MLRLILYVILLISLQSFGMYILEVPYDTADNLKSLKEKLSKLGIDDCEEKDKRLICLYTNDINQVLRLRDYLENNGIYSLIEEVISQEKTSKSAQNKKENENTTETVKRQDNIVKDAYCIQVSSSTRLQDLKKQFNKIKNYPYTRIEKIGKFYTLRVGLSKEYRQIKPLLSNVKFYFKDAFIRKCDYYPDRVIMENNHKQQANIEKPNIENKLLSNLKVSKPQNKVSLMYQYLNEGSITKAEKLAKRLKEKPEYEIDASKVLAIIYIKKGDFGEACKILANLYKKTQDIDVKKMLKDSCYTYALKKGYSYLNKNPDISIKYFQKALDFKKDINPKIGIGYAYLNKKDYKKAYEIFKELYKKYPQNPKVLKGYVNALISLKKFDELSKIEGKLSPNEIKQINDLYIFIQIKKINHLIENNKLDEAEKKLKNLYLKYPANINILLALGNLYLKKGELEKSENYYKNVLLLDPENVYALQGLKAIYMKKGNYKDALKIANKLKKIGIKVDDENKIRELYYLNLAEQYKKQKKYTEALKFYKKVLELNPKNSFALMGIGDIFAEKGDYKQALKYYSQGYEKNPDNFDVKMKFLYALLNLNFYDQIFSILSAIDKNGLTPEETKRLKKFYKDLYEKYSSFLYNNGYYKKSLQVAKEGLMMFPNDYKLMSIAGWDCYKLQNFKCAEKYFYTAYKMSNDEKIGVALAYTYLKENKGSKLKQILLNLENSQNPETLIEVSNLYLSIGEDEKAEKILKKVKKLEKSYYKIQTPKITNEKRREKIKTIVPNPFLETDKKLDLSLLKTDDSKLLKKKVLKWKIKRLEEKLNKAKQNSISNLSIGFKYRFKDGNSGTSKLNIFTPFVLYERYIKRYFSLYAGMSYPFINSGSLSNYLVFGSTNLPVIRRIKTHASGFEPFIGLNYANNLLLNMEIGLTPLGNTDVNSTLTGKFMIGKYWNYNKLKFFLERKPEKNSLLSYVGSKDPHSYNSWGRVIENLIGVQYEKTLDKNDSLLFSEVSLGKLKGKHTHENTKFNFSVFPKVYIGNNLSNSDYVGLYINYVSYKKDEDFYYYGYGGYFSPKRFIMITPTYEGFFFMDKYKTGIYTKLMAGLMDIKTSQYKETTMAFDGLLTAEKLLNNQISVKGGIELRKTSSYTEFFTLLSLNYYFGKKSFVTKKNLQQISEWMIK